MEKPENYKFNLDIKYNPLELIDIPQLVESCEDTWFNQTLTQVNDCVVRIGIIHGEFHWHKHDDQDEFFYVVDGKLLLDLEDRTVELTPRQGITVNRGVLHRTRAPEKTVILMVDGSGVKPVGD